MTYVSIGKELQKDHTTIITGIKRLRGFIDIGDERVCELVNKIESEINKHSDG